MTPLSKIDLAALRKADSMCFDLYRRDDEIISRIRAIKRHEPSPADPYARDIEHPIDVNHVVVDYDNSTYDAVYEAFHMSHSSQYSDTLQTILRLLRAGDELTLYWVAGNSNGYLEEANLYRDELKLVVMRGGKRALTFNVDTSICANNTARMVRRTAQTYALTYAITTGES